MDANMRAIWVGRCGLISKLSASPRQAGESPLRRCGRCGRCPLTGRRPWTASRCKPPTRIMRHHSDPSGCHPWSLTCVDTGDLLPPGRDAVIMREHVRLADDGSADIDTSAAPGRHVRPIGEDIQAGKLILPAGHRIRPVDAAALAAAGHHTIGVRPRPVVAVIPTGNEVRPVGTVLAPGEVLDTNSLMLAGLVEEAGGEALRLPIAPDWPDQLAAAVTQAADRADVVLVIAGSSAGRGDHTATVVRRLGRIAVHGVAMRPGHPVLLGMLSGHRPVPVVGVPGYPGSAERAFTCFVGPLLRRVLSMGRSAGEDAVLARLGCAVSSAAHLDEYLRLRLARIVDPRTGQEALVATPLQRGAGALNAIVQTEALLRIPVGVTGFNAGAEIRPVPVAGAAFGMATTIISGVRSPATDALLELCYDEVPGGSVQWNEYGVQDASEALSTGLCHAAALAQNHGSGGPTADPIAALVARIGELTVIEIARTGSTSEVLVVPAPGFRQRADRSTAGGAAIESLPELAIQLRRLLRPQRWPGNVAWPRRRANGASTCYMVKSIDDVRNLVLATRRLCGLADLHGLVSKACPRMHRLIGADLAAIAIYDGKDSLIVSTAKGTTTDLVGITLP